MKKKILSILNNLSRFVLLFLFSISVESNGQNNPTAAPSIKTFSQQADISGAASNSVNLFSGDVALPINLVSLPSGNGLDVNVAIGYNSNVQKIVDTWNREAPTGILGLGWSMDIPKIVVDHKQTGTREDDTYYLIEAGSTNRLVRTISGSDAGSSYYVYEAKSYKFWKIKYYYDIFERYDLTGYGEGPNKWEITKEDGTKYIYGDKNSGRGTLQYTVRWKNWIGNSAQTTNQSQLVHAWNLSEIVNIRNQKITFEYLNEENFVGSSSGKKQTEASYLKKIRDQYGRVVEFFYLTKENQYFQEPHTEQPIEPDAYQEFYEKQYLDHIDVLLETGVKNLSIHFGYSPLNYGTNQAKMLLTSIVEKNGVGASLPSTQFEYYTTGFNTGFLKKIVYPTKGTITYNYSAKNLGQSQRSFTAIAPVGFAEPKAWIGEDYVVVTWRRLGTGGSHVDPSQEVKVYVYEWVGRWKEQFLQTINGVELEGSQAAYKDYKDFQVITQQDFFAVLTRGNGNVFNFWAYHRNVAESGLWTSYFKAYDYGASYQPALLSGTNFIAVGSHIDDAVNSSRLFVFQGNSWREEQLNQPQGAHYYTSANNFFISHNRGPTEIDFHYLTEDKKWIEKNLGSALLFTSDERSLWYSSNGMAVAMADNNPEYAYRWDLTYTNFYKDSQDKNNLDLFGQLADDSRVFIINNSFVAIHGRLARYDGYQWSTQTISAYSNGIGFYYSYGDDIAVRPTQSVTGGFNGARKIFNPNTLSWLADEVMQGPNFRVNAGIDYFFFGDGYYYRQPNGIWVKKNTFTGVTNTIFRSGFPQFDVVFDIYPFNIFNVQPIKNGEVSSPTNIIGENFLFDEYKFKSNGIRNRTLVTYPSSYGEGKDASSLKLYRFSDDAITGTHFDYPVTLITVNDGTADTYTSIDYNVATATVDATGSIALYNEVTVTPGSNSPGTKPYGYTKTFFYNGLSSFELGISYMPVDIKWTGMAYKTEVFDNINTSVSVTTSSYASYNRDLFNDVGSKVDVGYYIRPTENITIVDGIETRSKNELYDSNTGLVKQMSVRRGTSFVEQNYVKYWWEVYDNGTSPRSLNILIPVIQTKKTLNSQTLGVSATRWKNWPCAVCPSGSAPGILDSYSWKIEGAEDFTAWNEIDPVNASEWKLMNSIEVNGKGQPIETTDISGASNSTIWHSTLPYLIANILNSSSDKILYEGFESCTTSCSTDAKTGLKSSQAIYNINLPTSGTYTLTYWSKTTGDWVLNVSTISANMSIGGSGMIIDEVRLHPPDAMMITYSYDHMGNVMAVCDENNKIVYTEYDDFHRVKLVRDTDKNILEHSIYNFKQ